MAAEQKGLKDKIFRGARAISNYTGIPPRMTFHLLETGRLPGFKLPGGRTWYADKNVVDDYFARLAAKPQEPVS
jgi:hypothetical protein